MKAAVLDYELLDTLCCPVGPTEEENSLNTISRRLCLERFIMPYL